MSLNRYLGVAAFSRLIASQYVSPRTEKGECILAGLGRLVEAVNGNPRGPSVLTVYTQAGDIGNGVDSNQIARQVETLSDRSRITDRLIWLSQHPG